VFEIINSILSLKFHTLPKNLPGFRLKNGKIALLFDMTITRHCLVTAVSVTGGRLEICLFGEHTTLTINGMGTG